MKRLCEGYIRKWLAEKKNALLISGARQVGKTYIIRKILNEDNVPFFEINFYNRPDIMEALSNINEINLFIDRLRMYSKTPLIPGKTIIFLDEVQAFPEIITKIKFLVDEGSFRYILSGSLLGVEIKNIRSVPVGYMEELQMYPFNLSEFALALGVKQETLDYIEECYHDEKPVDALIHKQMLELLNSYLVTGGMPEAVKAFIQTKNLAVIGNTQKNIKNLYKHDFSKYESENSKLKIIAIYNNMTSQLNKQNLKFTFTYLNKNLKFERYENSFLWLENAGVAYPVYISREIRVPLETSKEKNTFKLFFNDVGLLVSDYSFGSKLKILENSEDGSINKGALMENFVCEELKSNNLKVYYYKGDMIGELDFLVETDTFLNVIEVKSGKYYKKHKSLDVALEREKNNISRAFVLSFNNLERDNNILYLPMYMAGLIKNNRTEDYIINLDIAGL